MKTHHSRLASTIFASVLFSASATERFVDVNSASPASPYTNWDTAATTIQDAVDAASDGDQILVTNGVYQTGGRAVYGTMTNRVAVDKPLTVRSVNGPQFTLIQGRKAAGGGYGVGAIRCVYLTNGASLFGFTLTNGASQSEWDPFESSSWGCARCESITATISNCVIAGNSSFAGGGVWSGTLINTLLAGNTAYTAGGAVLSKLSNCTLKGNTAAIYGGGAQESDLNNCTLTGNSAWQGGGSSGSTLNNCVLTGNQAQYGGAVWYSTLNDCFLDSNSAEDGGGAMRSTLNNCILSSNSVSLNGGGVNLCTLNNCRLTNNSAQHDGGGAYEANLNNCTLSGNFATNNTSGGGGGAYYSTLNNCTLSENSAYLGGGAGDSTLTNCVLVANLGFYGGGGWGGKLEGCMLIANSAERGGGTYWGTLNGCTLTNNTANSGGGAWQAVLNNCALVGNSGFFAGGALGSTLNNCTVSANSAVWAYGGTDSCTLNNCIIYFNTAPFGSNYYYGTLNYCSTVPLPDEGVGNFTNEPVFVDPLTGDFRLQADSSCINAGNNNYVAATNDLDGNPRIAGGTVDISTYEFQSPTSTISYAWLLQHGMPTDGSVDFDDTDGDGHNTFQEWMANTDPASSASVFRLLTPSRDLLGMAVSWNSDAARVYSLERATNLMQSPAFSIVATNIAGLSNITTYPDTNVIGDGPFFYRAQVRFGPP